MVGSTLIRTSREAQVARHSTLTVAGFLAAASMIAAGLSVTGGPPAAGESPGAGARCVTGSTDRQAVFARAAQANGVPEEVLLGVSYMESRWDDHGGAPSTSAGYGPMHLTSVKAIAETVPTDHLMGKGEGEVVPAPPPTARKRALAANTLRTLSIAAKATGLSQHRLRTDPVANICGGAAVLASYQHSAGGARDLGDWAAAVARYSGARDLATATRFAEQVFRTIRAGAARVTNDGQRVRLVADRAARPDRTKIASLGLRALEPGDTDCPASLGCESLPAPYEHYGATPGAYGNHDLADRPNDLKIDYIIIHDTEATWDRTLSLVDTATYLAWHYSLRSVDGHIAQHVDNSDVGWHAGNWYVNMHSIGLEHEGFAAKGAAWYTESLYQNSATLVRYLAAKYDVPLDRGHIIGHDQIPGILPQNVAGMHWDPGPYWNWSHYMDLLGAPIQEGAKGRSNVVVIDPVLEENFQPLIGCETAGVACAQQGTNFVYLRTAPSADAPLVSDIGLRPNGSPSTTQVSDIGARAAAGHKFVIVDKYKNWRAVWWLGQLAWFQDPGNAPKSSGQVVVPAGNSAVPVYGRAYPEQAAYPSEIPYQTVAPLQYSIQPGQAYVLADADIQTDYYYAKTFECAFLPLDCTQVVGQDEYYEIWFGHRMAYVRAADVQVR